MVATKMILSPLLEEQTLLNADWISDSHKKKTFEFAVKFNMQCQVQGAGRENIETWDDGTIWVNSPEEVSSAEWPEPQGLQKGLTLP